MSKNVSADEELYYEAESAAKEFEASLEEGEQILWSGRQVRKADLKERGIETETVLFPVIMAAAGAVFTVLAVALGGAVGLAVLPLFVVPLCVFLSVYLGKRQVYAVTDRRLLIKKGKRVSQVWLDSIDEITVYTGADHVGAVKCRLSWRYNKKNIIRVISAVKYPGEAEKALRDAINKFENKR